MNISKKVNKDFFASINKKEVAWVLGFIAADGYLNDKGRLTVTVNKKDLDVIEKIKSHLEFEGRIYEVKSLNAVSISFQNQTINKDLQKLEITPRKSLTLKFCRKIMQGCYFLDYLRGYFDGDGCVALNKARNYIVIDIKGTKEFLEIIKLYLDLYYDINVTMSKAGNISSNTYALKISGNFQTIKFLNIIYSESTDEIRLKRKFNRAKELHNIVLDNMTERHKVRFKDKLALEF